MIGLGSELKNFSFAGPDKGTSSGSSHAAALKKAEETIPDLPEKSVTRTAWSFASIKDLPLEQLVPDPAQPRQTFPQDRQEELAKSLSSTGQLEPIIAYPDPRQRGKWMILSGERRYHGALQAGFASIGTICLNSAIPPKVALIKQLTMSVHQCDIEPIDKAKAYQRALDQNGWTQSNPARALGISRPSICRTLKVLTIAAPVQKIIERAQLNESTARSISRLKDPKSQKLIVDKVISDGLTGKEVDKIVNQEVKKRKTPDLQKIRAKIVLPRNRTVLVKAARKQTPQEVVNTPEEALEIARDQLSQ